VTEIIYLAISNIALATEHKICVIILFVTVYMKWSVIYYIIHHSPSNFKGLSVNAVFN